MFVGERELEEVSVNSGFVQSFWDSRRKKRGSSISLVGMIISFQAYYASVSFVVVRV